METAHWGGISPRRQLRKLFRLEALSVPPLAPLTLELAARVLQASADHLWQDPEMMATAHRRCRDLLGYPLVIPALVPGLEMTAAGTLALPPGADGPAEAAALPGRAGVYLEAISRLKATLGDRAALAGAVTGPWTLAHRLVGAPETAAASTFGAAALDADPMAAALARAETMALGMARRLGRTGVDVILVAEPEPLPASADGLSTLAPLLIALGNTIRYYNAFPVLVVGDGADPTHLVSLPDLAPGGVLFMHPAQSELSRYRDLRDRRGVAVGLGLPPAALTGDWDQVARTMAQARQDLGETGWFLSTGTEIPANTSLDGLRASFDALRNWQF